MEESSQQATMELQQATKIAVTTGKMNIHVSIMNGQKLMRFMQK